VGTTHYLCLHDKWTAYPNIKTLVEKNYKELLKALDYTTGNTWDNGSARVPQADAGGRIWVSSGNDVYDGSKWAHDPMTRYEQCWFSPDGKRKLTRTAVLDLTVWPPKTLLLAQTYRPHAAFGPDGPPLEETGATILNFFGFRRSGVILAMGGAGGLCAAGDDLKFTKMSARGWSNGNVTMERMFREDSSGRLWFNNWITIARDGAEPFIKTLKLRMGYSGPLVEQDPQTFWFSTSEGLLRVKLSGKETLQSEEKLYGPAFPTNCIRNMFIDKEGALWVVSQVGLYRFELPPADK
jgi:hypothetical protein